jgi:hypothetical protein
MMMKTPEENVGSKKKVSWADDVPETTSKPGKNIEVKRSVQARKDAAIVGNALKARGEPRKVRHEGRIESPFIQVMGIPWWGDVQHLEGASLMEKARDLSK